MSAIQMRPDLPQGATGEPTTPGDRIVSTFIAYFGTYTLEGKELTLNIKGSTLSRWQNTTATRTVEMQTPSDLVLIGDPGDMKSTLSAKRCAAR